MAKRVNVDWSAFRALVVSGMPIREAARQLGINEDTACKRSSREKWGIAQLQQRTAAADPRAAQLLQHTAAARAATTERTIQAGKDYFKQADGKTRLNLAKASITASETLSNMPGPEILENHQAMASVTHTASKVFGWTDEHVHQHLSIQGILFALPPEKLANAKNVSFSQLRDQYSDPVRDPDP